MKIRIRIDIFTQVPPFGYKGRYVKRLRSIKIAPIINLINRRPLNTTCKCQTHACVAEKCYSALQLYSLCRVSLVNPCRYGAQGMQ
jgi:hypothetical protein